MFRAESHNIDWLMRIKAFDCLTRLPVKALLSFFAALAVFAMVPSAPAAEPFLKPNDVIALVGGEDMVVAGELGSLEANLQRAFPDYHLKVRSLAWEGDTVFEQPRMLNYPPLERQLDEIGATVVIMQFGQMESLAGESRLAAFASAYEAMIHRLSGERKRRIVSVEPTPILAGYEQYERKLLRAYAEAVANLSKQTPNVRFVPLSNLGEVELTHRDGRHLNPLGQAGLASAVAASLGAPKWSDSRANYKSLRTAVAKKSSLWDRYRRPQNWAFLAGDRITQASSRDHLDPTKRWFPEEMKEFIPLIETKDREIWDLAAKIAAEKK